MAELSDHPPDHATTAQLYRFFLEHTRDKTAAAILSLAQEVRGLEAKAGLAKDTHPSSQAPRGSKLP